MPLFNIIDAIPPENRDEAIAYFAGIFGNTNPLSVEIGSGNGHFLVDSALLHPENNFIGTELLLGRAKKFFSKVEKKNIKNIVIYRGDARRFVWEFLYDNMVSEFFIMFPDPWPKKRHHKHRIITAPFINMMHHRLVLRGKISIATDHVEYRNNIVSLFQSFPGFTSNFSEGFAPYPNEYPKSIFEERFRLANRAVYFMQYIKIS